MSNLRKATHAGTWYENSKEDLVNEFEKVLSDDSFEIEKGRIIVSPHAGYSYSLPQILSSFKHLSLTKSTKTVIVIGPSHTQYFENHVKLSQFTNLQTPLGNLQVDVDTIEKLLESNRDLFKKTDSLMELKEHSLEMQYPVLKYLLEQKNLVNVKVIPVSISHFDPDDLKGLIEIMFGVVDPKVTSIVVSCDFTHWGGHFEYHTAFANYVDLMKTLKYQEPVEVENCIDIEIEEAHKKVTLDTGIKFLDLGAILKEFKKNIPETRLEMFMEYLDETDATICGKWPLVFTLVLLENSKLAKDFGLTESSGYKFIDYNKSSTVASRDDSSVSYVSGYIV
ncbi:UPF0103-domain-containing protein [Hanseniaspora valbyensis NRRL Y-1626]|uniref:UPF0103-domain-containing protein n=1 Tax=Hanseniaspora valbyensis NRRL Y-1626 TaxID=766949 RepID=A0A1B7TE66_9ASCO|nr:UPF0103-domain-containing protein [Hanseniaspora valbyensis NRRL Y-1626]